MGAADDPHGEQPAGDPPPDAVDRAAAVDDFFGGFATEVPHDAVLRADDSPLPGSLDLLLLLRQAGARGALPRPSAPASISRYRILRLAGRGGFSVVWEAFDPLLRRRVAIKACSPDALLSPTVRRRFRREAELASRLSHPHIVTIHEVGAEHDLDYITTEFCAGGSLAEWLGSHPGPVPPRVAARIAEAVAHAAAHAHAAGIVHRDIKPGNVMLVPLESLDPSACIIPSESASQPGMTVKLGDFGLGRQEVSIDGEDPLTQLTTDGARLGTPAWMAPEQIDRSFGAVGPATDVHAIGLLLDRMLTGRPLRGGKTDIETYREVLLDEPLPADRVARDVPPDLAAIGLKCLAKRPAERYPSAAALAEDLGRWLAGRPTHARPLTLPQRVGRSIARRPITTGLLAAAVLATCVAGWAASERAKEARRSFAQQDELRRQSATAELRRGFESLRSANVTAALEQIERTRSLDPGLADSLAARWLDRRLHGETEMLLRPKARSLIDPLRSDLYCLALSSGGDTIVAGGADGVLRVLRGRDRTATVVEIPAHDEVNDVCVSPDGRAIASVGQDGRLRVCTTAAPESPACHTPSAGQALFGVAFSSDGESIFYGGQDRILRRVYVAGSPTPREIHRFEARNDQSPEIEAIVRAGTAIVVAWGGSLAAFDETTNLLLWAWPESKKTVRRAVFHALAASPDGRRIAAGGSDREVGIWDAASGAVVASLPPHPNWIQACRFSIDGSMLATACRDGVVRIFDASTGELISRCIGHADRVWDVAFEPSGMLLSAGADGTLRRWDRPGEATATPLRTLVTAGPTIRCVRDATVGGGACCQLAAVRAQAAPLLVDVETGEARDLPVGDRVPHEALAVNSVRGLIAFGFNGDNRGAAPLIIGLHDGDPTTQPTPIPNAAAEVGPYVCWTPAGGLVTNATDGRVYAWSPSLDSVRELGSHGTGSYRVEAAPEGPPRIVLAARPGVILWSDDHATQLHRALSLEDRGDQVSAVAWAPNGRRLVCGFRNGSVHLFDAENGTSIGALAPHEHQVVDVAWSPDSRIVLTADADCVRVSDAATLTSFDDLRPGWTIETMCLAGDARFVAIGGYALNPGIAPQGRLALLDLAAP